MLWSLLVSFLRPYWQLLTGVIVFQLAQSIASLFLPTLNADIIDEGVATGDTGYILRVGGLMLLITLAQIGCAIVAVYFGAKVAMKVGRDLRGAVFSRVGEFSEQEVTRFGAPSLITRSTNDVQQVQMLVLTTCTLLVSAPILSIGGVIMAIRQDVQLSWLIAVSVPILLIAVGLIVVRMVPLFRKMQTRIDTVNRVLREQLTGIRVVRAFVREKQEIARFAKANQDVTDVALGSGRLMALMFPIVMLVLNVSSVAVIWFGAFRIEDGSMQVGTLIAFLSYLMQILMAVMMATFMAVMIPRAAVSADRIGEVLATASSVVPPANPVNVTVGHGELELLDVGFAYPGAEQPVLRNVSFIARHGDHRQYGEWQNHPSEPVAATVRRHKRLRSGGWRECARVEPRPALGQYRSRTAKALPVLRHCAQQLALRQTGCDGRGTLAGAYHRPGPGFRHRNGGRA
ncbi:hypothetical protein CLE01_03670 [Cryobacterium levicorallinum]|uniref:ATP-binding cassette, subfamily B n=1 Tax=Cryobacterium levicorallinum TaxID=995038 RepID=A0ABY1EBF7_9MICO|nr:hypothetical protein CLE01_03670 [Cryobacterium levicorallinum]SFH36685.1 ATP-binding cassette, subfamily B [Cryobacterium levicorallinum]